VRVADFDFVLPDELVAEVAAPRGTSRMLVLERDTGVRRDGVVGDLPGFLRPGDVLVVNNTRVIPARLLGRRMPSGGSVECLLLGPAEPASVAASDSGASPPDPGIQPGVLFDALVHPGQKLKPGARVRFEGPAGVLDGEILARRFHGRRTIRLWSDSIAGVDGLIDALGHVPLPPYIKRPDVAADRERYQTVFARVRGSVAAPTAGLHFTPALLDDIERRGVERIEITLHVGYGTFKPVRVEEVADHTVDPERYEIAEDAARAVNRALESGRRVVAVGTTTTRALEDAALRGGGPVAAGAGVATIFIHPGHHFRVVGGLMTNFHLPRSSLLMLVAGFAGRERVLEAYREAVERRYRFYSYGDAMLIL
jgi:S-adenosylmethionine:tRNA ribosyltransferase-isomerase